MRHRAIRSYVGWRYWFATVGLVVGLAGTVFGLCYQLIGEPSVDDRNFHPELEDVVYRVPLWPWQLAKVLVVGGAILLAIAWLTAPRWHEGDQRMSDSRAADAGTRMLTAAAIVVPTFTVLIASRRASPIAADLLVILSFITVAGALGVSLWLLQERRRQRRGVG